MASQGFGAKAKKFLTKSLQTLSHYLYLSESSTDVEYPKDTLHPKDTKDTLHPKDTKDTLHPKDTKDTLHPKDTKDTLHPKDTKDTLHPKDTKDTLHPKDPKDTLHPKDPKCRILLIGETGSGKTSFINLLCNYAEVQSILDNSEEISLEKFCQFTDKQMERTGAGPMESKTFGARMYDTVLNDIEIGITDTPGFGDSRGIEQDKENVKAIMDALEIEEYLTCICLVISGRECRMSATLRYVLTEISTILPKDALKNVIVLFTNTDDPLKLTFDLDTLDQFFGRTFDVGETFFLENAYCYMEKAKEALKKGKLKEKMITEGVTKAFKDTGEVLKKLCKAMSKLPPVHTISFLELYDKKQEIESNVLDLLTAYHNQEAIEKSIDEEEEKMKAALRAKNLTVKFRSTRKITKDILQNTERHNTLCAAKMCNKNCHIECNLPKSIAKEVFKNCACMQGKEVCQICGHSYEYHYHEERKFVQVIEKKEFVDEEMKMAFTQAQDQEERARAFKYKCQRERELSKREKEHLARKLTQVIDVFQGMSINRSYAKVIQNQLAVIEHRLEGTVGADTEPLVKTKKELEQKLKILMETLPSKNKHP